MARRRQQKKSPSTGTKWGRLRAYPPTLFLSLREVAGILRCQEATVRKMIEAKRLRAVRIGRGRSWRVPRAAVEALAAAKD